MKKLFYFEMTDTFGGETNYSWLHRFIVPAKSPLGAIQKISRETGFRYRFDGTFYRAKGACIVAYECFEYDTPPNQWLDDAKLI